MTYRLLRGIIAMLVSKSLYFGLLRVGLSRSFILKRQRRPYLKTSEIVAQLLEKPVADMGYSLYDVEYQKEQGAWILTLYIDKEGGVDIDDCEKVSRAIEPILDEKDPIAESYFLSVSSIGLDRPLKLDKDFERNLGEKISVKLYAPREKKKEFTGVLKAYNDTEFSIDCDGREMSFTRKDAAKIVPYIDFSSL